MTDLSDAEKLRAGADELEKILLVVPYIVFQKDMTPSDLRRIASRLEALERACAEVLAIHTADCASPEEFRQRLQAWREQAQAALGKDSQ